MKVKLPNGEELEIDTPEGFYTADQVEEARREALEKARTEERDKLYGKIRQTDDRYKQMEDEVKRLQEAEAARAKEAEKIARQAEAAKRAKEEAEKSAKELLDQRNQEWQQRLDAIKAEQDQRMAEIEKQREMDRAMMEKEREMAQLAIYIRDQIAANQDNIAPELVDLVGGNTREEVDASIQDMIARTGRIVEGIRQAGVQQRAGMPGVSPSGGSTAITPGLDTGDQQLTPEDIKGMSMKDFAALRQKVGMGSAGGRGIFG